ncbi:ATPase, T2SS/T4P/T4SS family, partial [Acinetobacter baumannii]
NEKKGLTFARGLRSILRHDPDKILVGEIRDHETAGIAVQAALTGHLVYTSVHANHALDVIGRFRHMQIDLFGFVS